MSGNATPPERIGPCRVVRRLGVGGMGAVFEAEADAGLEGVEPGTHVAVKLLHAHLARQPGFATRFVREAELGLGLVHPNLVRTLAHGRDGDSFYAVLELVAGSTLDELRSELGRVPEGLCLHIAGQVCRALAVLHGAGIVHRDLKPENVLITPSHEVRVMDLGIAKNLVDDLQLTRAGAFVGSPLYASPEQFRGHAEPRSDLYGLGVMLYELASGENPHRASGFQEVMRRALEDRPKPLAELAPQLSPFFEELVHTLLAKEPSDRIGGAVELLRVIDEREDGSWWRARAEELRRRARRALRRLAVPRDTSVHGRSTELELLASLFRAVEGGEGRVALISGEAGVGKSRLVDEFVARLAESETDVEFAFGVHAQGGGGAVAGLVSALRDAMEGRELADLLPSSPGLVPHLDALLRGDLPPESTRPVPLATLAGGLATLARELARERPLVLLVEDLQFAEEAGRVVFGALAHALAGSPVLLIGTHRRGVEEAWRAPLTRMPHCASIELGRLGARDVASLLEEALGAAGLTDDLGYQLLVKSDGNPFFLLELLRGLREGNFLTRRADGTWAATRDLRELQLPSSVLDLIRARVSGLSEEDRDLIDVAACLGHEFDPVLVGQVCGLRRIPVLRAFARLEREHRLVRSAGRGYVFDQRQVQEVLYDQLNEQLREAYHGCLADELDAARDPADPRQAAAVAAHRLRAAQVDRLPELLDLALRHLEGAHEHEEVVRIVTAVLARPGLLERDDRIELLLRVGSGHGALDRLARRDHQLRLVDEAVELAGPDTDVDLRLRVHRALSQVRWRRSENEEAEAAARRAIELAVEAGNRRLEAAAWGDLGNPLNSMGRYEEAGEAHERHARLARELDEPRGEAVALGNLGMAARMTGRVDEAAAHHERQLELAIEIGDPYVEANACANLGIVRRAQNDYEDARRLYERHSELCRRQGDREGEVRAVGNLANLLWSLGHLEEGRAQRARHLELCREIGYRRGEAIALFNLATSDHETGAPEQALQGFRECAAVCQEIGFTHLWVAVGVGRAAVLLDDEARRAEARDELLSTVENASAAGLHALATQSRCLLAVATESPEHVAAALEAVDATSDRLANEERLYCEKLLWTATGDPSHLESAMQRLEISLSGLPPADRDRVRTRKRLARELLREWRRHAPDPGDEAATLVDPTRAAGADTEAETRIDPSTEGG